MVWHVCCFVVVVWCGLTGACLINRRGVSGSLRHSHYASTYFDYTSTQPETVKFLGTAEVYARTCTVNVPAENAHCHIPTMPRNSTNTILLMEKMKRGCNNLLG